MSRRLRRMLLRNANQEVTVKPRTGESRRGQPTYGSGTTYEARVVGKRKRVIDRNGQEVVSSQTVYLASSGDQIQPTDQITLSTGDVGSTEEHAIHPPIISTARYPGRDGSNVYTAVFLK